MHKLTSSQLFPLHFGFLLYFSDGTIVVLLKQNSKYMYFSYRQSYFNHSCCLKKATTTTLTATTTTTNSPANPQTNNKNSAQREENNTNIGICLMHSLPQDLSINYTTCISCKIVLALSDVDRNEYNRSKDYVQRQIYYKYHIFFINVFSRVAFCSNRILNLFFVPRCLKTKEREACNPLR